MAGKRPAVVLLSGGLDSATVLAMACSRGFRPQALSFDYGQRHREVADGECSVNPTETSPQKKGYCYVCEG